LTIHYMLLYRIGVGHFNLSMITRKESTSNKTRKENCVILRRGEEVSDLKFDLGNIFEDQL